MWKIKVLSVLLFAALIYGCQERSPETMEDLKAVDQAVTSAVQ